MNSFMTMNTLRLRAMMFLLFFMYGTVVPYMGFYLTKELGFSGTQTGLILALASFSSFAAPVVGSCVADRRISSERLLALLLLVSSVILALLSRVAVFPVFALVYFAYTLFNGNTHTLANAVVFHHIRTRSAYGSIRLWGTLGWMAAAWFLAFVWYGLIAGPDASRSGALVLSSAAGLALGVFVLFFRQGPRRCTDTGILPRQALEVMRSRRAILFGVLFLVASIADRFYIYGAATHISAAGFPERWLLPLLTIGQIAEVALFILLSRITGRAGFRMTAALGGAAGLAKFGLLAWGGSFGTIAGIFFHGATFCLFFPVLTMLVDGMCTASSRAGVHQIYGMVTGGVGCLVGNLIAGAVYDAFRIGAHADFRVFWLIAAAITAVQIALTLLFIGRDRSEADAPAGEIADI